MNNQQIAEIFYEIADILEMKNIAWKPRAYRQAAKSIDSLTENIKDIYKKGGIKLLKEIPGVGEGIAKKIIEYLKTGKIKEYEKLKKQASNISFSNYLGMLDSTFQTDDERYKNIVK